jgi:hypothetical protein
MNVLFEQKKTFVGVTKLLPRMDGRKNSQTIFITSLIDTVPMLLYSLLSNWMRSDVCCDDEELFVVIC